MIDHKHRLSKYNEDAMCLNCLYWSPNINICLNINTDIEESLAIYVCNQYDGLHTYTPPEGVPVTITGLAKELKVAVSTVSYALNNTGGITNKTRLKVLSHAKKRGYKSKKDHINFFIQRFG